MVNPMTVEGEKRLREELGYRKGELRKEIVEAISEARAHGDLKENAEYHAAREQQSFNEGRILEIESKLADAQIVDVTKLSSSNTVIFAATIHLWDVAEGTEISYKIVGEDEADLKEKKISVMSPIARALIGKSLDDTVTVVTPSGENEYEIIKVEYK
mgnify:FL=1